MKKLFLAVLSLLLLAIIAENSQALTKRVIKFGMLSKLNSTEEQFAETWKKTYAPNNENLEVIVKFYDNLNAMQMALNADEINQMVLPDSAAEYVLNQTEGYEATLVLRSKGMGLSFGFKEASENLCREFNDALTHLKNLFVLSGLEGIYITSAGKVDPKPVKFTNFDGAETIKVAVTGDLPLIDYIAADGTPAGFNTAVLSEIGKFLKKNIEVVNIEAGARTAALVSGRVDVVFWYEVEKNSEVQHDVSDGIILSQPYYEWEKFIHIKKASKKYSSESNWNWNFDFMNLLFGE